MSGRRGIPSHRGKTRARAAMKDVECPCGKRVFAGKAAAELAAKTTKPTADRSPLHAYRCPGGLGWHVGHIMGRKPLKGGRDGRRKDRWSNG